MCAAIPRPSATSKRQTNRCLDLTHENIVRVYDSLEDNFAAAIAMEYVPGKSLSALKAARPGGCFGGGGDGDRLLHRDQLSGGVEGGRWVSPDRADEASAQQNSRHTPGAAATGRPEPLGTAWDPVIELVGKHKQRDGFLRRGEKGQTNADSTGQPDRVRLLPPDEDGRGGRFPWHRRHRVGGEETRPRGRWARLEAAHRTRARRASPEISCTPRDLSEKFPPALWAGRLCRGLPRLRRPDRAKISHLGV